MEEEARRWMDLALMVPEILLHVSTSEEVLFVIDEAYSLISEDSWQLEEADDVKSASDDYNGGDQTFGAPFNTACGSEYSFGVWSDTTMGSVDGSYCFGPPFTPTFDDPDTTGGGIQVDDDDDNKEIVLDDTAGGGEGIDDNDMEIILDATTGGGEHIEGDDMEIVLDDTTGGGEDIDDNDMEIILDATTGGGEHIEGDDMEIIQDDTTGGGEGTNDSAFHYAIKCWGDHVTHEFTAAHREITRLVSLHDEAGHVFALCAARLGLINGDEPWQRWREHRAAAVARAHDALLRLSSAASAAAAAQDLLVRGLPPETPLMKEWASVVWELVQGARRDVDEARDAVKLMRDAVACEFFETWMILKRA